MVATENNRAALIPSAFTATFFDWSIKTAPYLIAVPMAIFGIQHFIYLDFVANYIPPWIPWRVFWACFTGLALIAAAAAIVTKLWVRWAATLLGVMIFLWVLLLHTSRIAAQPAEFGEWRGIFQALAMSGCAFALAGTIPSSPHSGRSGAGLFRMLASLSDWGTKVAPWFFGVAMTGLGVEHFIFTRVVTPQVPLWIPGPAAPNYLTGAALVLCGIGICLPRMRQKCAGLLCILIFLSMLLFHLPVALRSSRFESDWTKTLVLSGGTLLLAISLTNRERKNKSGSPLRHRIELNLR